MVQKVIQISFISLVCLSSLVSSVMFDLDTLTFIFTGIAALLGIILSKNGTIKIRTADILFTIALTYGLVNQQTFNLDIVIKYTVFLCIWFYAKLTNSTQLRKWFVFAIVFTAVIHTLAAIMQLFHLLPNQNSFFTATALFDNPGPYGCYISFALAIYIPYYILHFKYFSNKLRIATTLVVLLLLYGLILADSRTAYLSTIISISTFLFLRSSICIRFKFKSMRILALLPGIILLMYMYRPASANARIKIWRTCCHAIAEAPLVGNGTGSFQKTYMLKQADYLINKDTEQRRSADEVNTAYNIAIELLYEQGIFGLLLWVSIIFLSIKDIIVQVNDKDSIYLLCPIISFLISSMFSYPYLIFGFTCPLIAVLSIGVDSGYNVSLRETYRKVIIAMEIILLIAMLIICVSRIKINNALLKYSRYEIKVQDVENCDFTKQILYHSPSLLSFYADIQIATEDYNAAISTISRLKRFENSYSIEKNLAHSYEITGDTVQALWHYDIAHNMCPGYLEPLFSKFLIYEARQDSSTVYLAKEILNFVPKINNPRTEAMKNKAIESLNSFNNSELY